MKKTIIFGSLLLGSVFASNTPNQGVTLKKTPKNVGHFTISMGGNSRRNNDKAVLGQFGFGYQTKIRDNSYIQSVLIELVPTIQATLFPNENYSFIEEDMHMYVPKISCLRYLNSKANNRFFYSLGAFLAVSCQIELDLEKNRNNKLEELEAILFKDCSIFNFDAIYAKSLGASIGIGMEFGAPTGAINVLKLEYNQPLRHKEFYYEYHVDTNDTLTNEIEEKYFSLNAGSISLTYGIGF